jgi:hypothetical protein
MATESDANEKFNPIALTNWFDVSVSPCYDGVYLIRLAAAGIGSKYSHYLCKWESGHWHWGSKRFNDVVTLSNSRISPSDLKSAIENWCGLKLKPSNGNPHTRADSAEVNRLIEELDG